MSTALLLDTLLLDTLLLDTLLLDTLLLDALLPDRVPSSFSMGTRFIMRGVTGGRVVPGFVCLVLSFDGAVSAGGEVRTVV